MNIKLLTSQALVPLVITNDLPLRPVKQISLTTALAGNLL